LEHNNYSIHLEWYLTFDHALLSIDIVIFEENIQTKKHTIVKYSEEEYNFINNLIEAIKDLKHIVQTFADCMEKIWNKHSRIVNITKHSKVWWDEDCCRSLENYQHTKRLED